MKMFLVLATFLGAVSAFANHHDEKVCAIAYNKANPAYSERLFIKDGSSIKNLNHIPLRYEAGNWDNRITKIEVAKGCTFIGYQYLNYGVDYHTGNTVGFAASFGNNTLYSKRAFVLADTAYDNKISSLKCFCL